MQGPLTHEDDPQEDDRVSQIYDELTHGWFERVTSHFGHPSHTITAAPQPAQEEPVSLTADLSAAVDVARAAEGPLRTLLDQHLPGLAAAVQALEDSRLVQAAVSAEHALPQPLKDALAGLLEAHAQAAPVPEQQPA